MGKSVKSSSVSEDEVELKVITNHRGTIPDSVILQLWARSGGRCQYRGCNVSLWQDALTLKDLKCAEMAHIIGASENGPRGNKEESEKLAKDISNLMLMCSVPDTERKECLEQPEQWCYPIPFYEFIHSNSSRTVLTATMLLDFYPLHLIYF